MGGFRPWPGAPNPRCGWGVRMWVLTTRRARACPRPTCGFRGGLLHIQAGAIFHPGGAGTCAAGPWSIAPRCTLRLLLTFAQRNHQASLTFIIDIERLVLLMGTRALPDQKHHDGMGTHGDLIDPLGISSAGNDLYNKTQKSKATKWEIWENAANCLQTIYILIKSKTKFRICHLQTLFCIRLIRIEFT